MSEKNTPYCFLNGKIVPVSEAKVGVYDIGLLRGFGIYEGLTTYNNIPYRYDDHYARFQNSAATLGISIPLSKEKLYDALLELVQKNGFPRTNLRIILTGGETFNGIEYDAGKPTLYILAEEWKALPPALYSEGGSLITFEHQRAYPTCKTINYITAVTLQERRKREGAIEILFISKDKVLEASTGNIFIVSKGHLVTPKENILLGITRKVIIELAVEAGIRIEEREVTTDQLAKADEVFITGSYKEIVPIVLIDGSPIGTGKVGEVTKKVMDMFREETSR